jgi:hypothetical protein
MNANDISSWNPEVNDPAYTPEFEESFFKQHLEWQQRDWRQWLYNTLDFPFQAIRHDADADHGNHETFPIGDTVEVLGLEGEDEKCGMMVSVRKQQRTGPVPLSNLEVTPKTDPNYRSVREYAAWFLEQINV